MIGESLPVAKHALEELLAPLLGNRERVRAGCRRFLLFPFLLIVLRRPFRSMPDWVVPRRPVVFPRQLFGIAPGDFQNPVVTRRCLLVDDLFT